MVTLTQHTSKYRVHKLHQRYIQQLRFIIMIQRPLNMYVSQARSRQLLVMHNLGECTTPLVCTYNPVQADSCQSRQLLVMGNLMLVACRHNPVQADGCQSRQLLVMCNLGKCTTPCVLVFQVACIHDPAQDPQGWAPHVVAEGHGWWPADASPRWLGPQTQMGRKLPGTGEEEQYVEQFWEGNYLAQMRKNNMWSISGKETTWHRWGRTICGAFLTFFYLYSS